MIKIHFKYAEYVLIYDFILGDEYHVSAATFISISRWRDRTWSTKTSAGKFDR